MLSSSSVSSFSETFSNLDNPEGFDALDREPKEGDFVLVQFLTKRSEVYYIGKLISNKSGNDDECDITYLRMSEEGQKFKYPEIPDIKAVALNDIKMIYHSQHFMDKQKGNKVI